MGHLILLLISLYFSKNLKFSSSMLATGSRSWDRQRAKISATSLQDFIDLVNLPTSHKAVIIAMGDAGSSIASTVAAAPIMGYTGLASGSNASGDEQKKLDVISNEIVSEALKSCGYVGAFASEENDDITICSCDKQVSDQLFVVFDPLDGSSNIDCASPTGTIFGTEMIAAGYILYSSSTEFVFSYKDSPAVGFTLEPMSKQWILTRPNIQMPRRGAFYSLNDGRSADWPNGLFDYVDRIKRGQGQTGQRYSSRYVCSLVADFHRTLLYGGWAGNPRKHLRLLFEAAPLAFIAKAAGGLGSDGVHRIETIVPLSLHHRLPVFLGSYDDILELESYDNVQQI